MVKVSVIPVNGGWSVVHDLDPTPLMFLTGGRAEAQALQIVRLATRLGRPAKLEIFTRDGQLAPARRAAQSPSPAATATPKAGAMGWSRRPQRASALALG